MKVLQLIGRVMRDSWWSEGSVTAESLVTTLRDLAGEDVVLEIDSIGGDAHAGRTMATAVRRHGAVTCRVLGLAASAAALVARSGVRLEMYDGTFLMVHEPESVVWGHAARLRAEAQYLETVRNSYARSMARGSSLSTDEMIAAMAAETWWTASEAVELGLADVELEAEDDAVVENRLLSAATAAADLWQRPPERVAALLSAAQGGVMTGPTGAPAGAPSSPAPARTAAAPPTPAAPPAPAAAPPAAPPVPAAAAAPAVPVTDALDIERAAHQQTRAELETLRAECETLRTAAAASRRAEVEREVEAHFTRGAISRADRKVWTERLTHDNPTVAEEFRAILAGLPSHPATEPPRGVQAGQPDVVAELVGHGMAEKEATRYAAALGYS